MTTTFLPLFTDRCLRKCRPLDSRRARQQPGELPQVQRKARRWSRATERLADAVVALAASDGVGFAGGEYREAGAGLVMVAAQVREIDVQRLDLRPGGLRERVERRESAGDRRRVGQSGARRRQYLIRGPVQRRQGDESIAPRSGQTGGQLRDRGHVLALQRREELAVAAVSRDARSVRKRSIHTDVTEVEVQAAYRDRV